MAELQRAFISPDMLSIGDSLISAVVTAARWPGDGLIITIRPVEAPEALASLNVVIEERDLAEIQKLLGEERQPLPMAWEDDLALARQALEKIYTAPVQVPGTMEAWRILALHIKGIAANALGKLMDAEADNGTPSDS